jgi:hypothetical protein
MSARWGCKGQWYSFFRPGVMIKYSEFRPKVQTLPKINNDNSLVRHEPNELTNLFRV